MEKFCLTKKYHFFEILTMFDQSPSKVRKTTKIRELLISGMIGKLILGKARMVGFWYQNKGEITNLNLFG